MNRRSLGRRAAALALTIVAIAGLGLASAAQLSINSRVLQAGTASVGTCQPVGTPVVVSFTTVFKTTNPRRYDATAVKLSGINGACVGKTYRLQVLTTASAPIDLNGAAAGTDLSGPIVAPGGVLTVAIPTTAAATIGSVAVLFHS